MYLFPSKNQKSLLRKFYALTVFLLIVLTIIALVLLTGKSFIKGVKQGSKKIYETTKEDVDYTVDEIKKVVERLRQMSPLYEDFIKKGK